MIKRESLQKKLAIAAMAGMLMLLLAASCVAQTPLKMSGPENCTNCSANASSSPGLDDAARETVLANASVRQVLEAPELISPSETVKTGKLTYSWYAVGGCQYYCLEVRDGQDATVIKHWYEASEFPPDNDGIILVTPPESLGPGTYTWSILCRDCGSDDQLSDLMEFTVCTSSSFPGRAMLVSPKDNIGSMSPTFVWLPVTGCTEYRLKVAEASYPNEIIFDEDLNVEDVYSDTDKVCFFAPPELYLDPGIYYKWWIKAINCKGEGPWSYYKSFRYVDTPPGKSTPLSPKGLISTGTPTFTWTASPLATEYHLQVINYQDEEDIIVAEGDFRADKVTKGFRCSGSLGILPDDDPVYYWRVQANNDASEFDPDPNAPTWGSWRYFETICGLKPGTDAKKARM
ncbi:MAG: hypothetical protein WCP70_04100 [Methanothrix sp.]